MLRQGTPGGGNRTNPAVLFMFTFPKYLTFSDAYFKNKNDKKKFI